MQFITRRRFLEDSMLAAAAAQPPRPFPRLDGPKRRARQPKQPPPCRGAGCRIRGKQHAQELARQHDCEIAYVCDPDRDLAAELAAAVEKQQGSAPKAVQDMRRVFDDLAVDAVFVATPNHWHALAAIWAMQAGKDVYVEKPVSHTISEGRRIVQVARKTGHICQGGTQNRSNAALAAAIDYIKQGKLGDVKLARSIVYGERGSIGESGSYEVPSAVDYNLWGRPVRMSPLTRPQFHYDWHWFWDTGNGELGNNNVHSLDICRWGLGLTDLGCAVLSYGGRLGYRDAGQTPNTQVVMFDFGSKAIVSETRGRRRAVRLTSLAVGSSKEPTVSLPPRRCLTRTANLSAPLPAKPRATLRTFSGPFAAATVPTSTPTSWKAISPALVPSRQHLLAARPGCALRRKSPMNSASSTCLAIFAEHSNAPSNTCARTRWMWNKHN